MKLRELFEDEDAIQRGHVVKVKGGRWAAVNQQGLRQEFDNHDSAEQYAMTGANDIADEGLERVGTLVVEH